MTQSPTGLYARAKMGNFAFVGASHYQALADIAKRHSVPLANLLLFDVNVQMNPGMAACQILALLNLDTRAQSEVEAALHLEGWVKPGSPHYGAPDDDVNEALPRAATSPKIPTLLQMWARLWEGKTGESLSVVELRDALQRRIYQPKSYPLPEANPDILDLFLLIREGTSIDTFFWDIAKFYPDIVFAGSAGVVSLMRGEQRSHHCQRVAEIQQQWEALLPGWSSLNLYLFHALAAKGVIAVDILRAFSMYNTPGTLKDGALWEAKRRLKGGVSGLVSLDKVLTISHERQ